MPPRALLTDHFAVTAVPEDVSAVQASERPEATVVETSLLIESRQTTEEIIVGCVSVMVVVAVKLDCAWAAAVIVMTLLVGIVGEGAVYNPLLGSIVPFAAPPVTLKVARVLLKFTMLAVH